MKKKFLLLLCCVILLAFVSGCSYSSAKTINTSPPQTISSKPTQSPLEILKDVLDNKVQINQVAYKGSYDEGKTYPPFYIKDLIEKLDIEKNYNPYLSKFAIMDMDNDKSPEIVIRIDSDAESFYEVLHYNNGKVYGYYFVFRAMEELKADGTFVASSGALDNSINKLSFSGETLSQVPLAYSETTDKLDDSGTPIVNYFIDNKPVNAGEFKAYSDKQSDKKEATWYELVV